TRVAAWKPGVVPVPPQAEVESAGHLTSSTRVITGRPRAPLREVLLLGLVVDALTIVGTRVCGERRPLSQAEDKEQRHTDEDVAVSLMSFHDAVPFPHPKRGFLW